MANNNEDREDLGGISMDMSFLGKANATYNAKPETKGNATADDHAKLILSFEDDKLVLKLTDKQAEQIEDELL